MDFYGCITNYYLTGGDALPQNTQFHMVRTQEGDIYFAANTITYEDKDDRTGEQQFLDDLYAIYKAGYIGFIMIQSEGKEMDYRLGMTPEHPITVFQIVKKSVLHAKYSESDLDSMGRDQE